jgi:SAF domain
MTTTLDAGRRHHGRRTGAAPTGPGSAGAPAMVGREAAVRRRRRPALWAAGAALVALGVLAAAALIGRAGDRVDVLALARTVPVGQTLQPADLTVAQLPADPAIHPIPAAEADQVVGKVAVTELTAGSLLTAAQLTDTAVPAAGEQLVGVAAKPGQLPARGLRPGDRVLAVPVPGDQGRPDEQPGTPGTGGAGGGPPAGAVPGRVVQVGPADADGAVTVDLLVGQDAGSRLAALASTGRLALVLLPAGAAGAAGGPR